LAETSSKVSGGWNPAIRDVAIGVSAPEDGVSRRLRVKSLLSETHKQLHHDLVVLILAKCTLVVPAAVATAAPTLWRSIRKSHGHRTQFKQRLISA
jgi:hypothetical protein